MTSRVFFTRSPRLQYLRKLVEENSRLDFERTDLQSLFKAVDADCAANFPTDKRGGWFSPILLGGTPIGHTPPHIVSAAYAIYSDLARGAVVPVSFLSGRLSRNGAMAVLLETTDNFILVDRDHNASPMTDILLLVPSLVPEHWFQDTFGVPDLNKGVTIIGWHAAAESRFTATCGGILLLHNETSAVLNPLAPIKKEMGDLFFSQPVVAEKVRLHRERLVDFFDTPADVAEQNYNSARSVVEAYLAKFP
jgi:hypothetical protein